MMTTDLNENQRAAIILRKEAQRLIARADYLDAAEYSPRQPIDISKSVALRGGGEAEVWKIDGEYIFGRLRNADTTEWVEWKWLLNGLCRHNFDDTSRMDLINVADDPSLAEQQTA